MQFHQIGVFQFLQPRSQDARGHLIAPAAQFFKPGRFGAKFPKHPKRPSAANQVEPAFPGAA